MLFVLSGFGLLLLCETTSLRDRILQAQENSMLVEISLGILGALSSLSTFAVWALMLYDWGTREFKSISYKRLWFLAMTFGMFIGSWIYYFFVYERGRRVGIEK